MIGNLWAPSRGRPSRRGARALEPVAKVSGCGSSSARRCSMRWPSSFSSSGLASRHRQQRRGAGRPRRRARGASLHRPGEGQGGRWHQLVEATPRLHGPGAGGDPDRRHRGDRPTIVISRGRRWPQPRDLAAAPALSSSPTAPGAGGRDVTCARLLRLPQPDGAPFRHETCATASTRAWRSSSTTGHFSGFQAHGARLHRWAASIRTLALSAPEGSPLHFAESNMPTYAWLTDRRSIWRARRRRCRAGFPGRAYARTRSGAPPRARWRRAGSSPRIWRIRASSSRPTASWRR